MNNKNPEMPLNAILKRRSIRKYKSGKVPDELIKDLLRAAMSAPSAGNGKPWYFIVINDREMLDKIPEIHPYSLMTKEASLAILVCADTTRGKHQEFFPQDCAAAIENMLIAATDIGLGGVWLGIYPLEDRIDNFRKTFNLPQYLIPIAIIPIGYPNEEKPYLDRYDESRVCYNIFQT